MKSRSIDSKNQQGYTLIELLIVMAIISIVATFGLLAFSNGEHFQKVQNTSRYLADQLSLIEQLAILKSNLYGFSVVKNGYVFFHYVKRGQNSDGNFERIENDAQLKPTSLPEGMELQLKVANVVSDEVTLPSVIFYPDGHVTPFVLDINAERYRNAYRIFASENGQLKLIQRSGVK